jgi:hypothetical protein
MAITNALAYYMTTTKAVSFKVQARVLMLKNFFSTLQAVDLIKLECLSPISRISLA